MIGTIVHGNLRILSLIGEGAMGAVFLAENVTLPELKYAVKVLQNPITRADKFQERFDEEARNQACLDHPNIVRVHDYFKENGRYHLVMEYVDGHALHNMIEAGKLKEQQAVDIMKDVLSGLDCAHRKGIIHRDVKPSNILVDHDGRARLTDFGIAVRAGAMRMTLTGESSVGTAAYMSPEQIQTPLEIDQRADVYSCGVVLFEMLTGKVPFDGPVEFEILRKQVAESPPHPRKLNSEIPSRLARIILLALVKNRRERLQGCDRFRQMLEGKIEPPGGRRAAVVVAAVVVGMIVIGLAASLLSGRNDSTEPLPAPPEVPESPPPAEPRSPVSAPQTRPPPPQADSEVVFETVTSALENFEFLCRESANLASKQGGRRIAAAEPNSAMVEQFDAQIKEERENIARFVASYHQGIRRLTNVSPDDLMKALARVPTDQRAYVEKVQSDVISSLDSAATEDAGTMMLSCKPQHRP